MPHVFVGPHPDVLGDGRVLARDQVVRDVDLDDAHNTALIRKGWLVEHAIAKPKPAPRKRPVKTTTQEAE